MRGVRVVGVGMTKFGKQLDRSLKNLTADAVGSAMQDARVTPDDIQFATFANAVGATITTQEMVAGQVCLAPLGLRGMPIVNVENACASGSTAVHLAWQAIASGAADVALAVGAEKMTHEDKNLSIRVISRAADVDVVAQVEAGQEFPKPYFMALYAGLARDYMTRSDVTAEDFAQVVVKNQAHGGRNPLAQYGGTVSPEDVLGGPVIVDPLTLLMCSPISDGAAAVVLAAEDHPLGRASRVRVLASSLTSGVGPDADSSSAVELAARHAYESASVGPEDVAVAEMHDAAAPAELMLYEELGLAEPGQGPALLRSGATKLGGRVPVNTSGGLLTKGHPIGATGVAQVCEATWQLRGEAGARQVADARIALTENGGGWVDGDNAAAAVHLFGRV